MTGGRGGGVIARIAWKQKSRSWSSRVIWSLSRELNGFREC
jgi:hypothetical protein